MKIKDILNNIDDLELVQGNPDQEISYIWADSRKIESKDIFLVSTTIQDSGFLKHANTNGSDVCIITKESPFMESAISIFAHVILSTKPAEYIQGFIADFLLGHPSRELKIFAVTGTNGKTTMTHLLHHFANSLGYRTGMIGTLHAKFGDYVMETGYTTPDSSTLQFLLKKMKDNSVEYVFMETSSHGLKLGRTNGLDIYCALFTNLSKDHLDFHPDMDDYRNSKLQLFRLLKSSSNPNRFGIVVSDAVGGKEMEESIQKNDLNERIFYLGNNRDFEFLDVQLGIERTQFRFLANKKDSTFTTSIRIESNLLGGFNVSNLALAISAWITHGQSPEKIPEITKTIPKIPGRFDKYLSNDNTRLAIVDYAHTPDALMNILTGCRAMNPSKLICLFGCGGDRDRTKRPEMAKIAQDIADFVIITSDNPRTEDPERILDEIELGFDEGFQNFLRIQDRRIAIQKGIEMIPIGGILAVCGKGHENYQIIGREKTYFDDGEEVVRAFSNQNKDLVDI